MYTLLGGKVCYDCGPPPVLWKQHRLWFWSREDANASTNGQLCWHNKSLVSFLTAQVTALLRANPNASLVSVSQNDNNLYCKDTAEMAIIEAEGSPMGPMLRAVNQIAATIAAEFPHAAIQTLAYDYSIQAPKLTMPRKNVIIQLCTNFINFAQPLAHPSNSKFQSIIEPWTRISKRTYIWHYGTSFYDYLLPYPNWFTLGPDVKFLLDHGVRGMFVEGSYSTPAANTDPLRSWLIGKLLWEPLQDVEALVQQFLPKYYGANSSVFIRLAMDTVLNSAASYNKTGFFLTPGLTSDPAIQNFCRSCYAAYLTPAVVLTAAQAHADALRAAGSAVHRRRIDVNKLSILSVVLQRWQELVTFAKREKIPWPVEATKDLAWAEFARVWALIGAPYMNEKYCDLACFRKTVFAGPTPDPPPSPTPKPSPSPSANTRATWAVETISLTNGAEHSHGTVKLHGLGYAPAEDLVLNANCYSRENGTNIMAAPVGPSIVNQVWTSQGTSLRTHCTGQRSYCMTGIDMQKALGAVAPNRTIRNMSLVMEMCDSAGSVAQAWSLRPTTEPDDGGRKHVQLVWAGAGGRYCAVMATSPSPDMPGTEARDVRLQLCPPMRLGLKTDDSATRVSFGSPAALVARLATRACCRCTDAAAGC